VATRLALYAFYFPVHSRSKRKNQRKKTKFPRSTKDSTADVGVCCIVNVHALTLTQRISRSKSIRAPWVGPSEGVIVGRHLSVVRRSTAQRIGIGIALRKSAEPTTAESTPVGLTLPATVVATLGVGIGGLVDAYAETLTLAAASTETEPGKGTRLTEGVVVGGDLAVLRLPTTQ